MQALNTAPDLWATATLALQRSAGTAVARGILSAECPVSGAGLLLALLLRQVQLCLSY